MKVCKSCGEEKPLEDFYPQKKTKDGLAYSCKSCRSIENRLYRQRNRERVNAKTREWQYQHPERMREYVRRYRARKAQEHD